MLTSLRRLRAAPSIVAAATILAACTGSTEPEAPSVTTTSSPAPVVTRIPTTDTADGCGPGSGTTRTDGVLTVATDDPANGQGYEGAVVATPVAFATTDAAKSALADGTLDEFATRWLTDTAGAPVLE